MLLNLNGYQHQALLNNQLVNLALSGTDALKAVGDAQGLHTT